MFVIGLTGGIGTGKTEVSRILQGSGAEVISADELGHQAYKPGTDVWREVVNEYGDGILTPSEEIDRAKLGAMVFENRRALERLNAIVHPRILCTVRERLRSIGKQGVAVAVVEAAVLLEASWESLADEVWVTVATEDLVLKRVASDRDLDADAVQARISSQMPHEERLKRADAVIENNGSLEELRRRVQELWRERVAVKKESEQRK